MISYFLSHSKLKLISILNRGVAGNSSTDTLAIINSLKTTDTNLAIILVGTNDFLNSAKLHTISAYSANITNIVNQLKSVGKRCVLMSIPPCWQPYLLARHTYPVGYGDLNEKVNEVNTVLSDLATTLDCGFFDLHKIFTDNGDPKLTIDSFIRNQLNAGTDDGVHPTVAGYAAIGQRLSVYLKANYKFDVKILCIGDSITYGVNVVGAGTADITAETYPGRLHANLD